MTGEADGAGVAARHTRILFVDDESPVLDALGNLLRKDRHRWDMAFVRSGEQALAELARAPVDIVITDMRMPGINGAALLAEVERHYPSTARLLLSGHSDPDAALRAVPVAQQFLSKPCDAAVLRRTIERIANLRQLLADDAIRRAAGQLEALPSVPRTYLELRDAAARPATGTADIARIIETDPAMTIKILQLVNSAYFGTSRQITSISVAAARLGLELLKGLALTARVFSAMSERAVPGFSIEGLQNHAILTGQLARQFLGQTRLAEEAFTAGLVHDVGQIIIALGAPQLLSESLRRARAEGRPLHLVEQEVLGTSHAEVGAYLLGSWGLPFSIVESVAYHHRPGELGEGRSLVLAAVHAAEALVDGLHGPVESGPARVELDVAFLERCGLVGEIPRWRALAVGELRRAKEAA